MVGTRQKSYIHIEETIYDGSNKILISELASLWFLDIKNVLRPSSYAIYQDYTDKYILPYIGNIRADMFNAGMLSSMLGSFCKENIKNCISTSNMVKDKRLSQYTAYLLESIVRSMFHYGAEKKLIPEISFGKAEFITVKKKEAMPLPELEMQKLLYIIEKQGEDLQLQVLLPLYAGLALSELCGLKWKDIDIKSGEIYVHRNLVRIQNNIIRGSKCNAYNKNYVGDADCKATINSTKIATSMAECELPENMCRKFTMPKKLLSILEKIVYTKKPDAESYVARTDKKAGRKRSAEMLKDAPDGRTLQYRLKVVGEKAGIKGLTFKMLRDTFTVMCLQAGADVYSVAYVLGTGVSTVCERYEQWLVRDCDFLKNIS